jgi:hypothetical protein
MNHDNYWEEVKCDAEKRIRSLFGDDADEQIADIVGDRNGLDDDADAKAIFAYVLKHGDSNDVACAILSVSDWRQACHELAEHGQAGV